MKLKGLIATLKHSKEVLSEWHKKCGVKKQSLDMDVYAMKMKSCH
jgi:hypothetical protein